VSTAGAPPRALDDESPEDAAFRAEARAWLQRHAKPREVENEFTRRYASADNSPEADAEHVRRCQGWQRTLFEGGWAGINVPTEYGGRGGTAKQARIFAQEQARFDVDAGVFAVGLGMVVPTLLVHGTEEQKQRYVPALLRGDEVWCQLFSEPGAGSDVASLATTAVRDGDEWIVNGQKVWTSLAHYSRWGLLFARTDPNVPKHRGLTYFVIDMHQPGVEVRALRQMTGQAEFNEVYFTDARVPDANRLGDVGDGWRVALTTLMNERVSIGGTIVPQGSGPIAEAMRIWKSLPAERKDAATRDELMKLWIEAEVLRLTNIRAGQNRKIGVPGPEGSTGKLAYAEGNKKIYDFCVSLLGADGMLYSTYEMQRPETAMFSDSVQKAFLRARANSIEGGTSEVMRNILGERVLGLPGDVRVDREVAWKDVPRN
jgi:alkylation response protein AidB-like acyl-CoA dehydrogenase